MQLHPQQCACLSMHACICMHMNACISVHAWKCMHISACISMLACKCMQRFPSKCMHAKACRGVQACKCMQMDACNCLHASACKCICMHACVHAFAVYLKYSFLRFFPAGFKGSSLLLFVLFVCLFLFVSALPLHALSTLIHFNGSLGFRVQGLGFKAHHYKP